MQVSVWVRKSCWAAAWVTAVTSAPSVFSASGAALGDGAPSTCGNGLESLNHIPVMSIFLVPRIKVFLCFWYKNIYSIIKCLTNLYGSAHWLVIFLISDLIMEDFLVCFCCILLLISLLFFFLSEHGLSYPLHTKRTDRQNESKCYWTDRFPHQLHFCPHLSASLCSVKWLWLSFLPSKI